MNPTKTEFARLIGCANSYVTKLRHEGLLVLDANNRVEVEATRALIAAAQGRRSDVASRWAAQRADRAAAHQAGQQGANAPAPVSTGLHPTENPLAAPNNPAGAGEPGAAQIEKNEIALRKARAAMQREEALAEQEGLKAAQLRGDLIDRNEVELAFRAIGAATRSAAETLPDQLAPVIAPVADPMACRDMLAEAMRNFLNQVGKATQREAERLEQERKTA